MANKEYTFKFDDYNKKIEEGIEPRFRYSEIDEIIEEQEENIDDIEIDTGSESESESESDLESTESDVEKEFTEELDDLETEIESSSTTEDSDSDSDSDSDLDMGESSDPSTDELNLEMRNINDYMKILNNNLKLDDSTKISKKMINDIEKIDSIIFGDGGELDSDTLDMGNREDISIDLLNRKMRNINDYIKIINNNLKSEDGMKIPKKMIGEIQKINTVLFE